MSKINNQSQSLYNIGFVQDMSPETAAAISGGAVTVTDVTLTSKPSNQGCSFNTNKAIEDLSEFGFDDATAFIAVNNNQTWRFYEDANFQGNYIDVGPDTAMNVGNFGMEISSLKAIT
ncbi:MAG: beta/gamma crystallin-related protein [Pleurocapsa sp.]